MTKLMTPIEAAVWACASEVEKHENRENPRMWVIEKIIDHAQIYRREKSPDKFVSPHAPPTGLTRELLEILAEECAEVIQNIQKAQRFGLRDSEPGQGYMNVQRIAHEIGDVIETLHWCFEHEILSQTDVNHGRQRKAARLSKYVQNRTDKDPKVYVKTGPEWDHETIERLNRQVSESDKDDSDDDLGAYQI